MAFDLIRRTGSIDCVPRAQSCSSNERARGTDREGTSADHHCSEGRAACHSLQFASCIIHDRNRRKVTSNSLLASRNQILNDDDDGLVTGQNWCSYPNFRGWQLFPPPVVGSPWRRSRRWVSTCE